MDFPGGSDGRDSVCNARDLGLIPGSGRDLEKEMAIHSSGEGNGNPFQCPCLENSMDISGEFL